MLQLLSPHHRRSGGNRPGHRKPRFELLERRDCLSAPTFDSMQIDSIYRNLVTLSGHISNGGSTADIEFGGVAEGDTKVVPAPGDFVHQTGATGVGRLSAVAFDQGGADRDPSNEVEVWVTSAVPSIVDFGTTIGPGGTLAIQGFVSDEHPGGLEVTIWIDWLEEEVTVVVDSSGHFYWSTTLEPGQEGYVHATVTDWFGQVSEVYEDLVLPL